VIVAFSTSSPIASVALITSSGEVVAAAQREARMNASGACLALLEALIFGRQFEVEGYLADLGPGSFTGVRVGVTLAKTMAFAHGVQCGGAPAFDLISTKDLVVVPNKKGEFFWRPVGEAPAIHTELPGESFVGYGTGVEEPRYPLAANFAPLLASGIQWLQPEALLPRYLVEPSISTPNKPFREGHG